MITIASKFFKFLNALLFFPSSQNKHSKH